MREELAKRKGNRGTFTATFKRYGSKPTYRKGYRGRRDDDDLPPPSVDYKLSHPTDLRLVEFRFDQNGHKIDDKQLVLFGRTI